MRTQVNWGSDVPISMPEALPPQRKAYVDMGGFCFTKFGVAHGLSEADLEVYRPVFAPSPFGITGGDVLP